jgi:hypothetical protein
MKIRDSTSTHLAESTRIPLKIPDDNEVDLEGCSGTCIIVVVMLEKSIDERRRNK